MKGERYCKICNIKISSGKSYCEECRKEKIESSRINRYKLLTPKQIRHQKKMHMIKMNKINKILIELKINGCTICGYNKCNHALDFHHTNPEDKYSSIRTMIFGKFSDEKIADELNKCILLCANCHREIETKARLTCIADC